METGKGIVLKEELQETADFDPNTPLGLWRLFRMEGEPSLCSSGLLAYHPCGTLKIPKSGLI